MTEPTPVTYRFSSLTRAFLLFWRGWVVLVPVLIVNAAVQSALFASVLGPSKSWLNLLAAVINGLLGLIMAMLIAATAVTLVEGHRGVRLWQPVLMTVRNHGWRALLWGIALAVVLVIGFAIWVPLGAALVALTPFVLVGAFTAERNPFVFNFAVLGRRFWRWLITALIGLIVAGVGYLVGGFVDFFLREMLGAFVLWLVVGFCFTWFTLACALIAGSHPRN